MSLVSVDTQKLPGRLSASLVNPEKVERIAQLGVAIGQFLGREIPSYVLAQALVHVIELVAEVPQQIASEGDQDAGVGTSEDSGHSPV